MSDWLGEFEQLVLFAVVSLEPDGYGATIRELIEDKAGRTVSAGSAVHDARAPGGARARRLVVGRADGGARRQTEAALPAAARGTRGAVSIVAGAACDGARRGAETGAAMKPPRIAAWLLHRLLDAESAEAISGDLAEEFGRRREADGAGAARTVVLAAGDCLGLDPSRAATVGPTGSDRKARWLDERLHARSPVRVSIVREGTCVHRSRRC